MIKPFMFLLALSLFASSCSSPRQTATVAPQPDPLDTQWTDRSIFKSGLVESEQSVLEQLAGASVYHIELNIADDLYHVSGHQEVQYTNTETIALNEIVFRLFPNLLGGEMKVSGMEVDGESVSPKLDLKGSLLIVPLATPLAPGSSTVLSMDFEVTLPQSADQGYGMLSYSDDILALAHAYPMIPVYDDEGWNAEIPLPYGDITYSDASFFLVKITAPKELTLVSSGREIERGADNQNQIVFVASGPARDFYLAASPLYVEVSKTVGEVTLRSYTFKEDEEGSQGALDAAARAIQVFSQCYAPYPYTNLDFVATPTGAFGIEYPGMIALAARIYDMSENVGGTPMQIILESTAAHEVGHQWFYNLVGNDQIDDPWLDEALAQFATLQYYEDVYGQQAAEGFKGSLDARWARVNYEKIPIGLPVGRYDGTQYSAIVYGRGPLFFAALREQMGTEAFNALLKDYSAALSWKIATPEFLQSLAEEHCACELDVLFNEWVYP